MEIDSEEDELLQQPTFSELRDVEQMDHDRDMASFKAAMPPIPPQDISMTVVVEGEKKPSPWAAALSAFALLWAANYFD